jgi:hypothetical protein
MLTLSGGDCPVSKLSPLKLFNSFWHFYCFQSKPPAWDERCKGNWFLWPHSSLPPRNQPADCWQVRVSPPSLLIIFRTREPFLNPNPIAPWATDPSGPGRELSPQGIWLNEISGAIPRLPPPGSSLLEFRQGWSPSFQFQSIGRANGGQTRVGRDFREDGGLGRVLGPRDGLHGCCGESLFRDLVRQVLPLHLSSGL